MAEHLKTPWHVDPLSATVYASDVPKGPARVADMRGWGYLTGKGLGALALSQDEAIDIQRANAAFIVEAVNSYDAMKAEIALLRSQVEEARGCLQEIMPLHRMVLEKYEGHPDEEFVNWRMDLGVVRRAIKIISPISSTERPGEVG